MSAEGDELRERVEWWKRTCTYWHDQAHEARRFRDMAALRADFAEKENAILRGTVARVEALADEWVDEERVDADTNYGSVASNLRAALEGQ